MLLIRARIAQGLSQKSLAGRLGLKEQQIQRYEASEYASASLARIRSVAEVWGTEGLGTGFRWWWCIQWIATVSCVTTLAAYTEDRDRDEVKGECLCYTV